MIDGKEHRVRRKKAWLWRAGALLLAAGAALFLLLDGTFLARWQDKTVCADLNADGAAETFALRGRRLRVTDAAGREVWHSEESWRVEDFLLGDIDRDGREDLLVLVWKRGSFGDKHPFWVERDETGYSQHIFIYKPVESGLYPLWMSSRLRPEVAGWAFANPGVLYIRTRGGADTRWGWGSWGLVRLDGGDIQI